GSLVPPSCWWARPPASSQTRNRPAHAPQSAGRDSGCATWAAPPRWLVARPGHALPPVVFDDGGLYQPSKIQLKLWNIWEEFWGDWVPRTTRAEPYAIV